VDNIIFLIKPFLLDLTLNQKTGERFTVFVAARNLLNKPYESFDDYFVPGLTVTAGIRMEIK
jgi:outer membrane receptor protein involved in Fe transport